MKKVKFASQADPKLLATVRAIAKAEGRHFQTLIEEALRDLIEKRRKKRK